MCSKNSILPKSRNPALYLKVFCLFQVPSHHRTGVFVFPQQRIYTQGEYVPYSYHCAPVLHAHVCERTFTCLSNKFACRPQWKLSIDSCVNVQIILFMYDILLTQFKRMLSTVHEYYIYFH